MSRKRKYPKTQGYYVYSHSIDGIVYYGVSKQQPCDRWKKVLYKTTALAEYLDRWENIEKQVIRDGLSKEDAYALEDYYIQNTQNCINRNRSGLAASDMKQYYQEHKEYWKQWYEQNREKCLKYDKQYYQEHKEEIKEHKKQYYQEHREELKEYRKQYDKQRNATTKRKEYMKQYMREYRAKKRASLTLTHVII